MSTPTDAKLAFAVEQSKMAGMVMRDYFLRQNKEVTTKADRTQVTEADTKINSQLIAAVQTTFPTHGVLGEEESYNQNANDLWVCDPIDGTDAFIHCIPLAMFSLAFVQDGEPQVGVLYDPFLDNLYSAVKGQGAWHNDQPLHVSQAASIDQAGILGLTGYTDTIYRQGLYNDLVDAGAYIKLVPGCSYRASIIARGLADGYIFPGLGAHDIAAAKLIIEEAGGKVTSLTGEEQRYDRPILGAILSNGLIHDDLVAAVQKFGVDKYKGH